MARAASGWTGEEDALLRSSYPAQGPSWCASRLARRSSMAVRTRASKLGLKRLRKNMGHVKLTRAQRTEAVRLYTQEKKSVPEIALRLGVRPDCVYAVLKAAGVERDSTGHRNKRWSDAKEREIADAYRAGAATTELAARYGMSLTGINLLLRRVGVELRPQGFNHRGKRWEFTDQLERTFLMRSSWEVLTAWWLDQQGLSWDYELVSYELSSRTERGKPRHYTPDFWVYGSDGSLVNVIDVKGRRTAKQDKLIEAFERDYADLPFSIWDEQKLRTLGFTYRELRDRQGIFDKTNARRLN